MIQFKIRSTEKLASSNTHGKCDVMRVMLESKIKRTNEGIKREIGAIIKSRHFLEQDLEVETTDVDGVTTTETITERMYVKGNDHEAYWGFSVEKEAFYREQLASIMDGKTEEEKQFIMFVAQTQTAGFDGGGWQGMLNWIPDTEEHTVVEQFTVVE